MSEHVRAYLQSAELHVRKPRAFRRRLRTCAGCAWAEEWATTGDLQVRSMFYQAGAVR